MSIRIVSLSASPRSRGTVAQRRGIVPTKPLVPAQRSGDDLKTVLVPPTPTTVSFDGNPIIMDARIALIFYGNAWNNAGLSPNASTIQGAISTILASPYISELSDYECNSAAMDTAWNVIVSNPNPPNPFSSNDAANIVNELISSDYSAQFAPDNQPNLYAVFLPPGTALDQANLRGAHSNDGSTFFTYQLYGSMDFITTTFTHELVEAMTDPDGHGWQIDPRNDTNWNEIADVCNNTFARIQGIAVASYFSSAYGACVVPVPDPPPAPPPVLPNGEYQITCGIMGEGDGTPYIDAVGGTFNGQPWLMRTIDAVARVQKGDLHFYTIADGERAEVKVGHSASYFFLTTTADETVANNLDVIASNSPCPFNDVYWE